ncbi:DUF1398 family protein [Streptomyces sp. NPDC046860]|uniref:DUF1398 family protein n=1 Tax=Streptomyces sp. NPDC046860 TaxID=3154495 RepID=UPI0033E1E7A2
MPTATPTTTPAVRTLEAALARAAEIRPRTGGFPYLAETLRRAGVTRCAMTVPSNAMLYLTAAGPVAVQGEPLFTGTSGVPSFDRAALITALRADQAGETAFPEFVRGCWHAGVVRYDVDLAARTCTYYGAGEESYVETYPEVTV